MASNDFDFDQMLVEDRINLARAQIVNELWRKPLVSEEEAAQACNLPSSTWAMLKARKQTPPTFKLGRRLYILTADLRSWLEKQAQGQS